MFGSTRAQITTPTFGTTGIAFGNQRAGSRAAAYVATADVQDVSNNPPALIQSISAMAISEGKSHELLRWEDYKLGDKGGSNRGDQSAGGIANGGSTTHLCSFLSSSPCVQSSGNPFSSSTSLGLFTAQTSSSPFTPQTSSTPFPIQTYLVQSSVNPFSSSTCSGFIAPQTSSSPFAPQTSSSPFAPQTSSSLLAPQTSSSPFTPKVSSSPFGPQISSSPFAPQTTFSSFTHKVSSSPFAPQTSSSPFAPKVSSSPFGPQTSSSPFAPQTSSSPFAPQASSSPFTPQTSSSPFAPKVPSSAFGPQTSSSPFGPRTSSSPFAPQTSSSAFGPQTSSSPYAPQTPSSLFAPQTSSSPFGPQTSSIPFAPNSSSSPFGPQTTSSAFGPQTSSSPFAPQTSSSPFAPNSSSSPFGPQTTSSAFGPQTSSSPFASQTSSRLFAPQTSSSPFGPQTSSSPFAPNSFSSPFGPQTSSSAFGPQSSSSLFAPQTSSSIFPRQTSSSPFDPQTSSSPFAPNFSSSPFGPQTSFAPESSWNSAIATSPLLSTSNSDGFNQTSPQTAQTTVVHSAAEALDKSTSSQGAAPQSAVGAQPAANAGPFGDLPAMAQLSISHPRSTISVQYGISSMPVLDKPSAHVRLSSSLTSRHLFQHRIRLPARKYDSKSNGPKVPFFSKSEDRSFAEQASTPFVPRENPRSLVVLSAELWPQRSETVKMSPQMHASRHGNENHLVSENTPNKEGVNSTRLNQKPNDELNSDSSQKEGWRINVTVHEPDETEVLKEHMDDIEALIPQLSGSDYYTEPPIKELAKKERAEPGYCCHVKDFVIGRRGYGSIMFPGETDVRELDLDSLVHFNNREVIVYKNEREKPLVGQGLNKPAEVTLLNIKCINKKTGKHYINGPKVEKYEEMLIKKGEEQGVKFVSYDPGKGEWKFRVQHFN